MGYYINIAQPIKPTDVKVYYEDSNKYFEYEGQKYLVCLNLSGEKQCVRVDGINSAVHCCGVEYINGILEISPYGYALFAL